jgi:cyclohexyl-isocyanide hydratase
MSIEDRHLKIGALIFEGMDQIDLTGPFEILSRIPNSTYKIYGLSKAPIRDTKGLLLTPDDSYDSAPLLDVLHVPGGPGQEELMSNHSILEFIRRQADHVEMVFSVCTGALILGAAGLLRGKKATTHWSAIELLPLFGAEVIKKRVVVDGKFVFAAGVTAGIDGALTVASILRGEKVAQSIQLAMEYSPEPPFNAGTPETAPAQILKDVQTCGMELFERRKKTALQFSQKS